MQLTIIIPNRNRALVTVTRTLTSIHHQLSSIATIMVIDYGSEVAYQKKLEECISSFANILLVQCPTQGQLWNKSRAINIGLKKCSTPYLMVADMDMLFHPNFMVKVKNYMMPKEVTYFKVGILTQAESVLEKDFKDYEVKFYTNHEATGITLFPTEILNAIGGFDEFYHGWGSEDTDIHMRLRNFNTKVHFYDTEALLLHQWHSKTYRSKESLEPFHGSLERINANYLNLTRQHHRVLANKKQSWGILPSETAYLALNNPSLQVLCKNTYDDIQAFCFQLLEGLWTEKTVQCTVRIHKDQNKIKTRIKNLVGKKTPMFIPLEQVNTMLLECVIRNFRGAAYHYYFDQKKEEIRLTIHLDSSST